MYESELERIFRLQPTRSGSVSIIWGGKEFTKCEIGQLQLNQKDKTVSFFCQAKIPLAMFEVEFRLMKA